MAAQGDISFELARFEWVTPDRLEVEGTWHGVRRRLARATLVIDIDGQRRRLRALPEDGGSPELWTAAFPWSGDDMPKLAGAELEVGRGIVVDLPRPRRSKARGAAAPQAPMIPATTRADKDAESDPLEALAAELRAMRARVKEAEAELAELGPLRARAEEAEAEAAPLRARVEEAEAEAAPLRARVEEAEAEAAPLRARVEEAEAEAAPLRARAEEAEAETAALLARTEAEAAPLRARAEEAEAEAATLRARAEEAGSRAEQAEAELTALRAKAEEAKPVAVGPDVARLRAELESVERERGELRARLDSTAEQLERATQSAVTDGQTQPMPPPTTSAGGSPPWWAPATAGGAVPPAQGTDPGEGRRAARRFAPADAAGTDAARRSRRPAERTARRTPEPPARERSALTEKVTSWVGSVVGPRDDAGPADGEKNGGSDAGPRLRAKTSPDAAQARAARPAQAARRRAAPRQAPGAHGHEEPSWPLRVIAIGLLALLLLALFLIVTTLT